MKIIMCEDNIEYAKENLRIVKSFLEEKDIDCTIKHFNKYEDTLSYIRSLNNLQECLYILDVGLKGEKNGLSLGREIRDFDGYKGEMIYVTGYGHSLGTVFKLKLRVLDFIDKGPSLESDLKEALKVFLDIYRDKMESNALVFKDGSNIFQVKPSNIIWIETDKIKKKIIIHTTEGEISTRLTLSELQEKLTDEFIQVHRCKIVNKKHIKRVESDGNDLYVVLTHDIKEVISKRKEKDVLRCIT